MKTFWICIAITLLITETYSQQSFTCVPQADCEQDGLEPGSKVPDKDDCTKYFTCLAGGVTPSSISCEDGEHFSSTSGECEAGYQCEDNVCYTVNSNSCSADCTDPDIDNIPVAGDCNKFISCSDATQTPTECPAELPYFNGRFCVEDSTECCQNIFSCNPETDCETDGVEPGSKVPDKDDCRRYFICMEGGNATPTSTSCGDGEHFSTTLGECETGEVCENNLCASSEVNHCSVDCDNPDVDNIPVAGDCNKFISCEDPTQTPQECTTEFPYFNGEFCVFDQSECCNVCSYECNEDYSLTADPENCNGYIICSPEGDEMFNCPSGEYFNVILKICVEETVPCSSYCSSSTNSSST